MQRYLNNYMIYFTLTALLGCIAWMAGKADHAFRGSPDGLFFGMFLQVVSVPAVYTLLLAWFLLTSIFLMITNSPDAASSGSIDERSSKLVRIYREASLAVVDAVYSLLAALAGFGLIFALIGQSCKILAWAVIYTLVFATGHWLAHRFAIRWVLSKKSHQKEFALLALLLAIAGILGAPNAFPNTVEAGATNPAKPYSDQP